MLRFLAVSSLIALCACTAEVEMPTPKEGEQLFVENCSACHGYRAEGSELSAGAIAPDLAEIAFRHDGEFPRALVLSKIDGYQHAAGNGQVMPEFGALLTGEQVPVEIDGVLTPTPRPLAALLAYLEAIQVNG